MATYVATDVFHHPDGVALAGEKVELDPKFAERWLTTGLLVEPATPKSAPKHTSSDSDKP